MKILNIGSLNFDKTYKVSHFVRSKESISALEYSEFSGGKGLIQSVAFGLAGEEVYHAGCIGQDGKALIDTLQKANVNTELINTIRSVSTGHTIIQVNPEGDNSMLAFDGANMLVDEYYLKHVFEQFSEGDILVLQNAISNVDKAICMGHEKGMKVVFNAAPISKYVNDYHLEYVDVFLFNMAEGMVLADIHEDDRQKVMNTLVAKYPDAEFVLTLGSKGAYYFHKDKRVFHDIFKVKAIDHTGSGDVFRAYFVVGIAEGWSIEKTLEYASAARALSLCTNGAAPSVPDLEKIEEFLRIRYDKVE